MTAQNPVKYAEDTLAVHVVWAEANTRLAAHEASKVAYLSALSGIRYTEQQIAAREGEIVAEQRGDHPDMKIMEFKQHVATVMSADEKAVELNTAMAEEKDARDAAKADMQHHELGLGAITARMNELAGLLHFYAAAKEAASRS